MALRISQHLSILLLGFVFGLQAEAGELSLVQDASDLPGFVANRTDAVGLLKVYPFKKADRYIQCTAAHLGEGVMLTAGHCFLGSYDCNEAQVEFGIPGQSTLTSKCVRVLKTEAAASAYNSARYDYALFQVDRAPEGMFSIRTEAREPVLGESLTMVGYPRIIRPRNRAVMAVSSNCRLSRLDGQDLFGRPRAQASVLHSCPSSAGMNGALIFNSQSGEILAVQQAGFMAPIIGERIQNLTSTENVAQSIKRLAPIEDFEPWLQTEAFQPDSLLHEVREDLVIRIGSPLAEAFPLGIAEPLNLQIGRFVAANGSDVLRVSVRVGAGTRVRVIDGNGKESIFDRYGYFEETLPSLYKSPVVLSLETDKASQAFSSHILVSPAD